MRAEDGADHGRLLVIEHELDAPAGLLGPWARARGLSLDTVHLGGGDRLPGRLPDVAGVVVLGSEQTAVDDQGHQTHDGDQAHREHDEHGAGARGITLQMYGSKESHFDFLLYCWPLR